MNAFKLKVEKSIQQKMTKFSGQPSKKMKASAVIEAIYYSNPSPAQSLFLFDADGDLFMFPIPGQGMQKVINPSLPITIKLPIYYVDEGANNQIILFGHTD